MHILVSSVPVAAGGPGVAAGAASAGGAVVVSAGFGVSSVVVGAGFLSFLRSFLIVAFNLSIASGAIGNTTRSALPKGPDSAAAELLTNTRHCRTHSH